MGTDSSPQPTHLLLYDGVCGFCNGSVKFLMKRDRAEAFRFAPLQSELAQRVLAPHGQAPDDLSTVFLLKHWQSPQEQCFKRSRAILHAATILGGPLKLLAVLLPLPSFLLDLGYRLFARCRYRLFGRRDTCTLPSASERDRFLGFDELPAARPPA